MKMIVLIQCCKTKLAFKNKAKNLYISPLFKLSMEYARKVLRSEAIHILSAQYGLLDLETEIEPYNTTLKEMSTFKRKIWAEQIIASLKNKYDLKNDKFIFLAGISYREFLLDSLQYYEIPLKDLSIGRQLQKLNQLISSSNKGFNLCQIKKTKK
jgi:hypothetical protein